VAEAGRFEVISEPGRTVQIKSIAFIPFLDASHICFVYEDQPKQLYWATEDEFYAKTKPMQKDQS
jgi:hypothetical protein